MSERYKDILERCEANKDNPLVADCLSTIKQLIGAEDYLEMELDSQQNVKQMIADHLGVGDEPRWKWVILEIIQLKEIKEKYNVLIAAQKTD